MEAIEYIRWKSKMCEEHDRCELCPLDAAARKGGFRGEVSKMCEEFEAAMPGLAVALVEKWKDGHLADSRVPLKINEFADAIHENAVEHGWWEEERTLPEILALCHSELSEALEAYRDSTTLVCMVDGQPEGIAVEMVDCMIRILDYLAYEEVDIEYLIRMKHEYNCGRPYRHGGKRI